MDFPDPDGPVMAVNLPVPKAAVTSSSARTVVGPVPCSFVTPSARTAVGAPPGATPGRPPPATVPGKVTRRGIGGWRWLTRKSPDAHPHDDDDGHSVANTSQPVIRILRQEGCRTGRRVPRSVQHDVQKVDEGGGDGRSDQTLEHPFRHERHPDEPVGGPHQLHHRDLAPAGEDGHADGIEDQDGGRDDEDHGDAEEDPLKTLITVSSVWICGRAR